MVAAIGAVAGVAGAAISANGAKSAAGAQSAASEQATQAQMMAAAQQRADLQPWVQSGTAAQSRLNQFLGIGGIGTSGRTSSGLSTGMSRDQVRQQLLSQYTRQSTAPNAGPMYRNGMEATTALGAGGAHDYFQQQNTQNANTDLSPLWTSPDRRNPGMDELVLSGGGPQQAQGPSSTIDEEGLNSAIAKYYEEQDAQSRAAESDPAYGSLLRAYRNGEEFSFTGKDLATDPGYQFGLNQGTQGIERGQASRGNFLSGAAMKELNRFNQDYAGTKFNEGFNRAQSTWNTNQSAYDNNRSRIYSFLTGASTLGQNSAAQVGAGNQQAANQISGNMLANGNVNAAAAVAGGNALQSGINQAANSYNWNNMLSGNRLDGAGQSNYDYGFNGQSNPSNQAALNSAISRYQG